MSDSKKKRKMTKSMSHESNAYMPKSKSDTHITPDRVFEIIEKRWGYKREEFYDPCPVNGTDGLDIDWEDLNYVNSPYPLLREFVHKAHVEKVVHGHITIMLLPSSKTDQDWFHDYIIERGYDIKWIRKRLKFKGEKWGSPQAHFLVKIAPNVEG